MNESEDPVIGRYEDALRRLRDLEQMGLRGEVVPHGVLVSETRAIRDDMIADRRDRVRLDKVIHDRIDKAVAEALPRKPWAPVGRVSLTILIGVAIVVIGALLLGGPR